MRALPLALLVLTSGCAAYHPAPLDQSQAALAAPAADILSTQTAKIDRPWLQPVAIDLARPLDSNAVAILAVLNNPDLKAQRVRLGVTDAQAFAARLLPDPSFSFSFDRLISGPDQLDNVAAQIGQDLGLIRDRKVIAQQNRARMSQVRLDLAWAEWQTAGAARLQLVRVLALEEQVRLNRASSTSAQALLDASLKASLRGDIAADPVQANRLSALDAADRLRTSDAALAAARGELAQLIGLPPGTPLRLVGSEVTRRSLDPARLFAIAQHRRTDLEALRAGYDAEEAAVHKAVLDQFPTLSIGLGANRDSTGNKLLSTSVGFTLPLWNRNRGGIAIEKATRAALKADYDARLAQTRSDIATAIAGIAVVQSAVDELTHQIPALEQYATGARRASGRGDVSATVASLADQTLRDREAQLSAAQQSLAEQMIALELLTGAPIDTWGQEQ